nr:insulin:SUBUNIT=B chain [Geotria australis]
SALTGSGGNYLCGSYLVDALYLACGPRGFFYTSTPV